MLKNKQNIPNNSMKTLKCKIKNRGKIKLPEKQKYHSNLKLSISQVPVHLKPFIKNS